MRVYLTRHGETEWNTEKRMQGWLDSDLTENGIKAAKALGERLKDISFSTIYASPSGRTLQTAKLITESNKQKEIKTDERLREIHLGNWQGKTQEEIKKMEREHFEAYFHFPHLYNRNDGETFADVQKRAISFWNELIEKHHSGNVLVVSHGMWLKSLLNYLKKEPIQHLWDGPFHHGTSLSIVKVNNHQIEIETEACTKHLI